MSIRFALYIKNVFLSYISKLHKLHKYFVSESGWQQDKIMIMLFDVVSARSLQLQFSFTF